MYDDAQYANSRLVGTIVREGGSGMPVMVHECEGLPDGNIDVVTTDITKEKPRKKRIKLHDLNISSMPLGYINVGVNCYYVSRIPRRDDWRQGLRDNQLTTRGHIRIKNCGKELVDMLQKKYPSFEECVKLVKEGEVNAKAFCRVFAVSYTLIRGGNPVLLYKGQSVGEVVDGKPDLKHNYIHLKERLERYL